MKHRLELMASVPIQVVWHENKAVYFSVKKENKAITLRLHRLFYDAPTPVLEALIRYALDREPKAKAIIRQMAHLYFSSSQAEAKPLKAKGLVYDLQEILLSMQAFLPGIEVSIGWSDRRGRGKFRSITFGTYDHHRRQIRINPLLDQKEVPLYFLEYIVYHEMLHAVYPSQMDTRGRCSIHTKEFREKERQFPLFKEAKEWEKKSFKLLKELHGRT